jgi:hypothetical protein
MLAESPALLQRLIARTQRITLPRSCAAVVRHARLRAALCRPAAVRATYALLDDAARAALHDLRQRRGGIAPADLVARYGPIRPLRAIAADPHPHSVSEHLLLLGWLLPRPAAPQHPPRYLVPPELRRWLPRPLDPPTYGVAPMAPLPPALAAATGLLLTLAERAGHAAGLALDADGALRVGSIRLLATRLPLATTAPLLNFVLALLGDMGLVAVAHGHATLLPPGQRFLRMSRADQLERLRAAWMAQATPDTWLRPYLIDDRGIDWPLLRRRLVAWAAQLPSGVRDGGGARRPRDPRMWGQYRCARPAAYAVRCGARAGADGKPFIFRRRVIASASLRLILTRPCAANNPFVFAAIQISQRRHALYPHEPPTTSLPPLAFRGGQHPCSKRDGPLPDAAGSPSLLVGEGVRGRGETAHSDATNIDFVQTFCPPLNPLAGDQGGLRRGRGEPSGFPRGERAGQRPADLRDTKHRGDVFLLDARGTCSDGPRRA